MTYFDIKCTKCGHVIIDHALKFGADLKKKCPKCKAKMRKLPSRIQTTYNQKGNINK